MGIHEISVTFSWLVKLEVCNLIYYVFIILNRILIILELYTLKISKYKSRHLISYIFLIKRFI